ncbi:hypothetical protein LTR62_008820 [Meristemomyces frigidus]|uniref:Uncharacterized protein n=1 Tax=Meristemomyces frigidus TaxID=1508187 RepID=A0AAN7YCD5_9PEZI|nr:hypothetical protein LTR62_008820 [Meristemomyces frigidus]
MATIAVNGDKVSPLVANGMLPGTTIPEQQSDTTNGITPSAAKSLQQKSDHAPASTPQFTPGPTLQTKGFSAATTLTLYEPNQLPGNPILEPLRTLINTSFRASHNKHKTFPAAVDRLYSTNQYLQNLGTDAGTFTYIVTDNATGKPIATAGAHRYKAAVFESSGDGNKQGKTFVRVQLPAIAEESGEGAEVWELKLMAVDVTLQGAGLASYLMDLVDKEVLRRVAYEVRGMKADQKVFMLITTVKEINGEFYARRGYEFDYETVHEVGYMGSEMGFCVVHMSKVLEA